MSSTIGMTSENNASSNTHAENEDNRAKMSTTTSNTGTNSIFVEPDQTRLVTIVAHVDHGKTTLADNLIEYNGLISERLAGTIRYLDSDPEEQRRGITIRSSAIALKYKYNATITNTKNTTTTITKVNNSSENNGNDMIVHIFDSPGHTDFAMEVSSAVVACDGALVVIDVVEGMGPRSHQVLRETYKNALIPILVINKIDKLFQELHLTPLEAYVRIRNLLESVNATVATIITSSRSDTTTDDTNNSNSASFPSSQQNIDTNTNNELDEEEEKIWTFDPIAGNVIFCSALYGWGFTVPSLTRSLYRTNAITIKPMVLKQYMFGDYKLVANANAPPKIVKWKYPTTSNNDLDDDIPLFAKYGLQPIWSIYEGVSTAANVVGLSSSIATTPAGNSTKQQQQNQKPTDARIRADTNGMDQVLQSMQIGCTNYTTTNNSQQSMILNNIQTMDELQSLLTRTGSNTEEAVLRCLLRRYRPIADCILHTICDICPSPVDATRYKVRSNTLSLLDLPSTDAANEEMIAEQYQRIRNDVKLCNTSPDSSVVAHICKFVSTDILQIKDSGLSAAILNESNHDTGHNNKSNNVILGVARVLCGRLRNGGAYYLLGPNHQPQDTVPPPQRTVRLYLLMGSSFVHVPEVPAGHICAVYYNLYQVEGLKTVTLCDSINGMPLRGMDNRVRPLVKVNIEPENPSDMDLLEYGLSKLALADAAVEITTTSKGERILACLGEIHLEQSILELEKTYCGKEMKLRISDPIVDFAETTTWFDSGNSSINNNNNNSNAVGGSLNEFDYTSFLENEHIAPLRQTTIPPYNEEDGIQYAKHGRCRAILSGRCAAIWVRVIPLEESIYKLLKTKQGTNNEDELDEMTAVELQKIGKALNCPSDNTAISVLHTLRAVLCSIDPNGNALIEHPGLRSGSLVRGIESEEIYAPATASHDKSKKHAIVKDETTNETEEDEPINLPPGKTEYMSLRAALKGSSMSIRGDDNTESVGANLDVDKVALHVWKSDMRGSIDAGFQLGVRAGPVCEEPVRNVLVVLECVEVAVLKGTNDSSTYRPSKALSGGMVVSSLRSGIRCSLLSRPVRLMEGHLRLTLHSSLAGLGALYSVLSKRRGRVLDDSMVDGTELLMITASIPQAEAFGLAPELFGKTSGEVAAPEMIFSHWECLDVDPFWIPTSEEEREDFGELQSAGDSSTGIDNNALSYIRMVRTRKGLMIDSSRTVISAEKQRTLKR